MMHLAEIKVAAMERGRQARAWMGSQRSEPSARRLRVRWMLAILAVTLEVGGFVAWMRRRGHQVEEAPTPA